MDIIIQITRYHNINYNFFLKIFLLFKFFHKKIKLLILNVCQKMKRGSFSISGAMYKDYLGMAYDPT